MKQVTLRQARQKAKLTQEALADKSGVDQTTISNLEVGRAIRPTFDTACALAAALNIDPRRLKFGQRSESAA
jgi:transcriptional regulator with XRE-family HTH domain